MFRIRVPLLRLGRLEQPPGSLRHEVIWWCVGGVEDVKACLLIPKMDPHKGDVFGCQGHLLETTAMPKKPVAMSFSSTADRFSSM